MFWKNYFSLLSGRLPESKSLLVCDPRNHKCFISVGDYYRCAENSECLITVDAVKFLTKSNTHLLIYDKSGKRDEGEAVTDVKTPERHDNLKQLLIRS